MANRTPIPLPELAADLAALARAALVLHGSLAELVDTKLVPTGSLPNLHASRKSAESLVTHLTAAHQLVEGA